MTTRERSWSDRLSGHGCEVALALFMLTAACATAGSVRGRTLEQIVQAEEHSLGTLSV